MGGGVDREIWGMNHGEIEEQRRQVISAQEKV